MTSRKVLLRNTGGSNGRDNSHGSNDEAPRPGAHLHSRLVSEELAPSLRDTWTIAPQCSRALNMSIVVFGASGDLAKKVGTYVTSKRPWWSLVTNVTETLSVAHLFAVSQPSAISVLLQLHLYGR